MIVFSEEMNGPLSVCACARARLSPRALICFERVRVRACFYQKAGSSLLRRVTRFVVKILHGGLAETSAVVALPTGRAVIPIHHSNATTQVIHQNWGATPTAAISEPWALIKP